MARSAPDLDPFAAFDARVARIASDDAGVRRGGPEARIDRIEAALGVTLPDNVRLFGERYREFACPEFTVAVGTEPDEPHSAVGLTRELSVFHRAPMGLVAVMQRAGMFYCVDLADDPTAARVDAPVRSWWQTRRADDQPAPHVWPTFVAFVTWAVGTWLAREQGIAPPPEPPPARDDAPGR